jgi:excisionase family DNA binding protein
MTIFTILCAFWRKSISLFRSKRGEMPAVDLYKMFERFPDVLTIEKLQEALSIGRTTAYRLISSGAIRHWKIGKVIKVPKPFLLDYIAGSCYNDGVVASLPSEGGK